MINKTFSLCLLVLLATSSFAWSFDPMNPTNFNHQIRKNNLKCYPDLSIKLSIARVHDNLLVKTPFGTVTNDTKVTALGSQTVVVENPEKYDTSGDEQGYGKGAREQLMYNLESIKCLQQIERENINNIVSEWDFQDTKYVKKSKEHPALEMPEIIAKGFLSYNDNSCNNGLDEADSWGDVADKQSKKDRLQFLLRIYDTKTSFVKLIACGTGNTVADTIKNTVNDFKKHIDLLLPNVNVTSVTEKTVVLNGGSQKGLEKGIKFYIVRSEVSKKHLENYDTQIEHIAFCEVTKSKNNSSTAEIKELFSDKKPQKGDLVFYYSPEEEW